MTSKLEIIYADPRNPNARTIMTADLVEFGEWNERCEHCAEPIHDAAAFALRDARLDFAADGETVHVHVYCLQTPDTAPIASVVPID